MQDENDIRHATLSRPKPAGEAKPKKEEKPKRRAVAGGDLYSMVLNQGNASAELIDSERARRQSKAQKNAQYDQQIAALEKAIVQKYNIPVMRKIPNTIANGGMTDPDRLTTFGTTLEDRRNPLIWGQTQIDRTYHTWLAGRSGSGKGLYSTTKVLKFDEESNIKSNYITIKEIQIGDQIYTRDGKLTRVIGKYPQGSKQIWEVELANGQIIECDSSHLWVVTRTTHGGTKKEYVKSTQELYDDGIRVNNRLDYRNAIPLCSAIQFEEANLPIDPYILGCLLGDGCITSNKQAPQMSSADIELIELLESKLKANFGADYEIVKHCADSSHYGYSLVNGSHCSATNQLLIELNKLGLTGHYSYDKFIPEIYKNSSVNQRLETIRGLMDTDGTTHKGRVSYCTMSPYLRDDFIYIIRSLGFDYRIYKDTRPEKYVSGDTAWSIAVICPEEWKRELFHLERKINDIDTYLENRKDSKVSLTRSVPVAFSDEIPYESLPMTPYLHGIMTVSANGGNQVAITDGQDYLMSHLKELIPEIEFKRYKARTGKTPDLDHFGYKIIIDGGTQWNGKMLNKALVLARENNLAVSRQKKVFPELYLTKAPVKARQEFLQAILDWKGVLASRYVEFSEKNESVFNGVKNVVESLGYPVSVREDGRNGHGKILVIGIADDRLFTNPEKIAYCNEVLHRDRDSKRRVYMNGTAIIDIRKTDRYDETICLKVDDPTESFLIENFTVTHNSTLIQHVITQDNWAWRGGLLLEPHGDLSEHVLHNAAPYRIHDTLYLNVLDRSYSPGFNPLELGPKATDADRQEAVGSVTSLMTSHFNMDSGMVRLAKTLENALNALAYVPGATLLEVMDFYNNPDVQKTVLSFMPESALKEQITQAASTVKSDELGSLDNRMTRFMSNRYLKHLFGQSHTTVPFFDLMNQGAMVICPVMKGGTSDDFFLKFYGSYIISTVYKCALMRESIPEPQRVIFPLSVDEFQNFMSGDIENMLAELRKYGLPMLLAHQFLAQLKDPGVKAAIDNSCATKMCYKVGAEDAAPVSKKMPGASPAELMRILKYQILAYPLVQKENLGPFLTQTFLPLQNNASWADDVASLITDMTRHKYMQNRDSIEQEIKTRKELLASGDQEAIIRFARECRMK